MFTTLDIFRTFVHELFGNHSLSFDLKCRYEFTYLQWEEKSGRCPFLRRIISSSFAYQLPVVPILICHSFSTEWHTGRHVLPSIYSKCVRVGLAASGSECYMKSGNIFGMTGIYFRLPDCGTETIWGKNLRILLVSSGGFDRTDRATSVRSVRRVKTEGDIFSARTPSKRGR